MAFCARAQNCWKFDLLTNGYTDFVIGVVNINRVTEMVSKAEGLPFIIHLNRQDCRSLPPTCQRVSVATDYPNKREVF